MKTLAALNKSFDYMRRALGQQVARPAASPATAHKDSLSAADDCGSEGSQNR